jgi:transcriptional regulator with XRE-family HTH domain
MSLKTATPKFGQALRAVRLERGLSQEDFYEVSGRTHLSRLENQGASPSLNKVAQLAQTMGVHPLTLLTLSFCSKGTAAEVEKVLAAVREEIASFENLRLGTRDRHRRTT